MQQNQHVVAQGSNLRSQAENVIGTFESELKQKLLASRMTREQDADVIRKLSFRNDAAEEPQQNLNAHMRIAAEPRFASQAEERRIEIERLKIAATHDKDIAVAMLENQARLTYTQPMGQNRISLRKPNKAWPIDRNTLKHRSTDCIAKKLTRLSQMAKDNSQQWVVMQEKGRQHDLQVAEHKRNIGLASNTVGDELAEKMSQMQEEHTTELQSRREQTNVTMHDVIRNNASMDAKHQEEKQSMQAHVAQLSRNMREESRIAIARISAKLQLRDNEIPELQIIQEKHGQMMG